ncbi:MAG: hypothetical protein AAGD07_22685 [Planctomycetota bacterium]
MKNPCAVLLATIACLASTGPPRSQAEHPPLWYYAYVNLAGNSTEGDETNHSVDEMINTVLPSLNQLGYKAIVLSSYDLGTLTQLRSSDKTTVRNLLRLRDKAQKCGIEIIPEVLTVGSSGPILQNGPEFAEAFPVKNCVYKVEEGPDGCLQAVVKDETNAYPKGCFQSSNDESLFEDFYFYNEPVAGRFLKPTLVVDPSTANDEDQCINEEQSPNQVLQIQYCDQGDCESDDEPNLQGCELVLASGTKYHQLYSINVKCRQQYRLSFRIRTQGLTLAEDSAYIYTNLKVNDIKKSVSYNLHHVGLHHRSGARPTKTDDSGEDQSCDVDGFDNKYEVYEDQEWTRYTISINTFDYQNVMFGFGMGGVTGGTLWIDDVQLKPATAFNLLRRPNLANEEVDGCLDQDCDEPHAGLPVCVRLVEGENESRVLQEGLDFDLWKDPCINDAGDYPHEGPCVPIQIRRESGIPVGSELLVSYYHAQAATGEAHRVSVSLRHPEVHRIFREQLQLIHAWIKPTRWLVNHDELWMAGHDPMGRGTTPLESLGDILDNCLQIVDSVNGEAIVVSDMYDPHHNACVEHPEASFYPFIKGSFCGSWAYLPDDVSIWNWSMGEQRMEKGRALIQASFKHFDRLGLPQIVGGYYDVPKDASDAQAEARQLFEVAKQEGDIIGLCFYTTKRAIQDLAPFAAAAREVWPSCPD